MYGLVVRKSFLKTVHHDFVAISPRVARLTLPLFHDRLCLIVCYAPIENNGFELKLTDFYSDIDRALSYADWLVIVEGDFNCGTYQT